MIEEEFPKKNKYRAQRRALNRRKEDKVLAYASRLFNSRFDGNMDEREKARMKTMKYDYVKRHKNGISRCSCIMCANRRQFEGETIQERRHGCQYEE